MKFFVLGVLSLLALFCALCSHKPIWPTSAALLPMRGRGRCECERNCNQRCHRYEDGGATNDAGFYLLPNLPIGSYTLTIERDGFRRYVREGISLEIGQSRWAWTCNLP